MGQQTRFVSFAIANLHIPNMPCRACASCLMYVKTYFYVNSLEYNYTSFMSIDFMYEVNA